MLSWVVGLIGSGGIAGYAYSKRSLSGSGAAAAVVVGTSLYALGSAAWFGTLIAFFATSTFWSKWKKHRKSGLERDYAKTGRRDAGQVLANGGIGVLLALGNAIWPNPYWLAAFIGVMATVNADTWATEIGGLSRKAPRHVLTWRVVRPGASGGVTWLGTMAAALGGALIGMCAWTLDRLAGPVEIEGGVLSVIVGAAVGGLVGAFADSLLGATVQRQYRCSICGKQVERLRHCDSPTAADRGYAWCTNDAVNAISSIAGALFVYGFAALAW